MLVGGAASALLVVTAIFVLTRGSGDSETTASAVALNSGNTDLASQLVASPSADDDDSAGGSAPGGDGGGDLRSSGVSSVEGDADDDAGDNGSAATLEVTTSSAADSSTTVSTGSTISSTTTSTIAEVTTSNPTTSSTTVETTVPTSSSTTEATSSTTEPVVATLPTNPPQRSITAEDLAKARTQWASMGYDSYSMTLKRYCFCLPGTVGSFDVVVRSGKVASVTPLEGQTRLAEDRNLQSFTVAGVFDMIERGLDASRLHVVFDNQTGVPTVMEVDHHQLMVDDEMSVYISNLRALRG